jgi:hypothetical protein
MENKVDKNDVMVFGKRLDKLELDTTMLMNNFNTDKFDTEEKIGELERLIRQIEKEG